MKIKCWLVEKAYKYNIIMIACNSRCQVYVLYYEHFPDNAINDVGTYFVLDHFYGLASSPNDAKLYNMYISIYLPLIFPRESIQNPIQLVSQLVIEFSILVSGTQLRSKQIDGSKQPSNIKLYIIILFRIHWHHAGPITPTIYFNLSNF